MTASLFQYYTTISNNCRFHEKRNTLAPSNKQISNFVPWFHYIGYVSEISVSFQTQCNAFKCNAFKIYGIGFITTSKHAEL